MRRRSGILLLTLLVFAGCESDKEARVQARAAYLEGQQQGAKQWQAQHGPEVMFQGPVRNPMIPWTENLTLAKAIVDADYTGFLNPVLIRVIRDGQVVEKIRGIDLLHGQDFPLEAEDIVDIVQ